MTERAAFLSRIIAEPDEDSHRLVYADWLEEFGGEPKLGEFIRWAVAHPDRSVQFLSATYHDKTGRKPYKRYWATNGPVAFRGALGCSVDAPARRLCGHVHCDRDPRLHLTH